MTRTFLGGLAAIIIGAVYYYLALQIRETSLADTVGPAGVPKGFAFLMIGLGLALLIQDFVLRSAENLITANWREDRRRMLRATGLLLIGILYLLIVPFMGYLLTIAVLVIAVAAYQGAPMSLKLAGIGFGGALMLWITFVWLLGIPMPAGSIMSGLF